MRRREPASRVILLLLCLMGCGGLIVLSAMNVISPLESLAATPLNWVSGLFNRAGLAISGSVEELQAFESMRQRNAELEIQLARLQSEVVSLREIGNDYTRLAALLSYTSTTQGLEFVAADVINRDTSRSLRTIVINRGTRDGVRVGMAVVTENGLVGRIINVGATFSRVMLVTADESYISARLQTTRDEGMVAGLAANSMEMRMIPLNSQVVNGDLVLTSGLGGNLPPDLVIGQVESSARFEAAAEQTARVRSFVDFERLEIVLIVTSFEPIDLSIFED